jgi:antitoxin component YwqK of YwqJK toxin-antitoxin module
MNGTYRDGQMDGVVMYWLKNGQKQSEEVYENGIKRVKPVINKAKARKLKH